jgi:hypothetical protein
MKNISTKTAPNDRRPPATIDTLVCMNHACGGICIQGLDLGFGGLDLGFRVPG